MPFPFFLPSFRLFRQPRVITFLPLFDHHNSAPATGTHPGNRHSQFSSTFGHSKDQNATGAITFAPLGLEITSFSWIYRPFMLQFLAFTQDQ